ncbi:MAG: ribonuclease R [Trueperaceae bacterium]
MSIDKATLYTFFKKHPDKSWHIQDLQKQLKIQHRTPLRKLLGELEDEGKLVRSKRRTYGLPIAKGAKTDAKPVSGHATPLFEGRLQITSGGYGFVIPEDATKEDLFIPVESLKGAWDGDTVAARMNPVKRNGRTSGEVVTILQRKYEKIVGTLEYSRGYAVLRPDSVRLRERINLTPESVGTIEAGTRLVAKIIYPETSKERYAYGEVELVLGDGDNPEIETQAVLIKYNLRDEFEGETLAEAKSFSPNVTESMWKGRLDLRAVTTVTIDGEDAKDFDDAISLERTGRGKAAVLRVGIHIADVSYYVKENSALDKEARDRATSVYLPGRVLPMLPEALSNGLCSLVEGKPRLTLSALVDITPDGNIKKTIFKETVIQSNARLTYEGVQAFSEGEELPKGKKKLGKDLTTLIELTQTLRKQRLGAGALDFDFSEAKVNVDDEGEMHLTPIRSNVARQLIEELMLLANRLVAAELEKKKIPALFRVHEDPSDEKMLSLKRALGKLGFNLEGETPSGLELQAVLKQVAGKPEANLVSTLMLRSLKQARYSAENLGHFGLAFEHYLHFTSPIRRYPDLIVHRVLRNLLLHKFKPELKERYAAELPALAQHTSERERNAEDAERDLTRYYHARWAKDHINESFNGVISGVTNFGMFIALPNGVEGLVHISQLDDDYYIFLEDSLMLLGKNTRRRFRMGDRLDVTLVASNPVQRQVDLLPTEQVLRPAKNKKDRPGDQDKGRPGETPVGAIPRGRPTLQDGRPDMQDINDIEPNGIRPATKDEHVQVLQQEVQAPIVQATTPEPKATMVIRPKRSKRRKVLVFAKKISK